VPRTSRAQKTETKRPEGSNTLGSFRCSCNQSPVRKVVPPKRGRNSEVGGRANGVSLKSVEKGRGRFKCKTKNELYIEFWGERGEGTSEERD